ncbi:MAG: hypothetical protein FWE77_02060 [Clostridia bacterium]|nr:hypothetical protein [Clostridia bacterium]
MKKTLSLALALVLSLTLLSAALAITEGDYIWEGHTVTLVSVNTKPMFAPADMTDDQYAIALELTVPASLLADDAPRRLFFEQAKLVDESGKVYSLGAAATGETGHLLLFAVDKGTDADALSLQFIAGAASGIPQEYVGQWAGKAGDINLSFDVGADGAGTYTFEQSGYYENYDFALQVDSEAFSVQIPKGNQLGIASCEGTYAYADGVLTLEVQTTFANGRVFSYTVPCQRVE